MCGIVGYIGSQQATDILIEGLRRLEYRGYDSAGVAVIENGHIALRREVGKLRNLERELINSPVVGNVGIGHTRWATHGRPTAFNAHPHTDCSGKLVVVHNGIIENYQELKQELSAAGHSFKSDTDTEVIAHLVESLYQGDLETAVREAYQRLRGAFAIAVLHHDEPDKLVGIRQGAPLIAGVGQGESFLASDVSAIVMHTRDIVYLEDGEMVVTTREGVWVYDRFGTMVPKGPTRVEWNVVAAEKQGYDHFMLKEIHDQPSTIAQALSGRFDEHEGKLYLDELGISDDEFRAFNRVLVVACGTALYAGWVGKYLMESFARLPVEIDFASEFRYRNPVVDEKTLVIVISQSGETADTLEALRESKRRGAKTVGILNVQGSTIHREVHGSLLIHAGPEISVASTKAYTAMVATLTLLAIQLGAMRGTLSPERVKELLGELKKIPTLVASTLERADDVQFVAQAFAACRDFLFLGRGINFPTAMEGALKLKEISYIHAEAYAAGEMKHGPIALIDENMPTLAVITASETYEKVLSNLQEVKARGGLIIAVASDGDIAITEHADRVLYVPRVSEEFSPLINAIPLQLLAYYIARLRGLDVDQPRNLAKSVTVE